MNPRAKIVLPAIRHRFAPIWKTTKIGAVALWATASHVATAVAVNAVVMMRSFVAAYIWLPLPSSTGLGVYDSNLVYRQLGQRLRSRVGRGALWFAIFTVPLFMVCTIRDRLCSQADTRQFATAVKLLHSDVLSALVALTRPRQPDSLLADIWLLVVFAVIMPLHSVLVLEVWDTVERAASQMRADGLVFASASQYELALLRHRRMFNSGFLHLLAYAGAIVLTAIMLLYARRGVRWWGDFRDPISALGLTTVLVVAWYQLLWHNFKGVAALRTMRLWLSEAVLKLDLFHPDGVYGLRLIARTLTLSMLTTALHAIAVLCLVRAGFIPGGVNVVTVIVVAFFVVFFPAFAAYPLFILWRRSHALKTESYAIVAARLKTARLNSPWGNNSEINADLVPLALLVIAINKLPVHPFRRTATSVLVLGYALQIASALLTLLPVGPTSAILR